MALLDSAAASQIVDVYSLKLWSQISARDLPESENFGNQNKIHEESPFPYDYEINKKVSLWYGDITQLSAHAIVHSTNEHFSERALISQKIYEISGHLLKQYIKEHFNSVCKTGDAKLTKGYGLSSRYIIHTVGPKYNAKYHTAAESALFMCYAKVLQLVRENSIKTLGLCAINTLNRGYPRQAAAHIALRVVRRFIEKHHNLIDMIVFVVDDVDIGTYELLMPLYFPRSKREEEYALYYLPQDIGGDAGEPVIPEREIRITAKPLTADFDDSIDLSSGLESSVAVGKTAFAKMHGDVDKRWNRPHVNRRQNDELTQEIQRQHRYERLLRKSKKQSWDTEMQKRFIYVSGQDRYGRPVVVVIGKRFNAMEMCNERYIMFLISMMDQIVEKDYVVIYFQTLSRKENHPSLSFIKYVYNLLDYKYKKQLKALFIVHPNFYCRFVTWWFTTFTASAIKNKVFCIGGVEFLKSVMPLQQLQVPSFIMDYDFKVNGVRYSEVQDAQTTIDSL